MAITHSWTVENLNRRLSNDAIYSVQIKVTATDGTNTGEITNSLALAKGDPSSSDWVNYSDLTETKCLEWVKTAFTGLESDMETLATAALTEKTAPKTKASGKPF